MEAGLSPCTTGNGVVFPALDYYPTGFLSPQSLSLTEELSKIWGGGVIKGVNAHNTRSVSSFATYHPLNIPIPLLKYSVHQSADELDLLLHEA